MNRWNWGANKRRIYWGAAALALAAWFIKKVHSALEEGAIEQRLEIASAEAREENGGAVAVRAVSPSKENFQDEIPVHGTVTGTKIQLRFEVGGTLKSLPMKPGMPVRRGEALAVMDDTDARLKIQYRQARVDALKSQFLAAQNKLDTYEKLFQTGYLLEAKLEDIRLEKENKEKEMLAAKLEVESAEREFDKLTLKAPCDGVVSEREAAEGEFIPAGNKIGSLVDLSNLYLEFNVTERYFDKVTPGQAVRFKTQAYPGREFEGTIEQVVPVVEGKSRTLAAKVGLRELAGEARLIPGMFAQGWVRVYNAGKAVSVPAALVQQGDDGGKFLWVADEAGCARKRAVQLGYTSSRDAVEILAGLADGDRLVTESPRPLEAGEPVRVVVADETR